MQSPCWAARSLIRNVAAIRASSAVATTIRRNATPGKRGASASREQHGRPTD